NYYSFCAEKWGDQYDRIRSGKSSCNWGGKMSENWVEPSIPSSFWMRQVSCKCMSCGTEYECDLASGNEIIKFSEDGGGEVKWLPVFERGGYMELLEKLVPDYSRKDKITMSVARIF